MYKEAWLTIVLAPGDRTHLPESALPIFNILSEHVARMKQMTPVCVLFLVERILHYSFHSRNNGEWSKTSSVGLAPCSML